jgi:hypothetical protein
MSSHTQIKETRTVLRDADDNQTYQMRLDCVDEGPLNDKGVFVFQIFNTRNALADIFQRVAEVVDVETYVDDRDLAVSNGDEYWRTSSHTLTFDDVEVATAAVRTISDRVNTLVNDFVTYQTDFETTPPDHETLNFPTAEPTIINERKEEYEDSVTDYNTAVESGSEAITARDDAQTALDTANTDLLEWQKAQDKVCGGNISGTSNEIGLNSYVTDVANAFKNLYNGSGGGVYATNAVAVKAAMNTFIGTVENLELASSNTKRLTVIPGKAPVPTDIGKKVQIAGGAAGYGYLTAYDLDDNYWWVNNQSGVWTDALNVEVVSGSGAYGELQAHPTVSDGPLAGLSDLEDSRDDLTDTLATIALPDGILDKADDALADATDTCSYVTGITNTKTTEAAAAAADLKTKEAAAITAQGAIAAAYAAVITAYDAVKEVCPTWSPDPPLPAQP